MALSHSPRLIPLQQFEDNIFQVYKHFHGLFHFKASIQKFQQAGMIKRPSSTTSLLTVVSGKLISMALLSMICSPQRLGFFIGTCEGAEQPDGLLSTCLHFCLA
jgi:hypothetical protein